jgi:hypothetical protein
MPYHSADSAPVWLALVSVLGSLSLLGCAGEGGRSRNGEATTPPEPGTPIVEALVPAEPESQGGIDASGELLLDELADGTATFRAGSVSGEWFTYSDGTSPISPPDHTGLGPVEGEAHVAGQGFSDWGAGLSAYFRSTDLSAFCSVKLAARGSGVIVVELATPATSPANEGGTCVGQGCFGHFASSMTLGEEYQIFEIPFSSLLQPTWAQRAELSLSQVISINLVSKVSGAPTSIDLFLRSIALQTCSTP